MCMCWKKVKSDHVCSYVKMELLLLINGGLISNAFRFGTDPDVQVLADGWKFWWFLINHEFS